MPEEAEFAIARVLGIGVARIAGTENLAREREDMNVKRKEPPEIAQVYIPIGRIRRCCQNAQWSDRTRQ